VSLPGLVDIATGPDAVRADGNLNFVFAVATIKVGGGELFIANGDGSFNSAQAQAQGSFNHVEVAAAPPFPLLGSGTWKSKRLVEWAPNGVYGAHASGTLVLEIVLVPNAGDRIDALLTVNCNLGPAGLFTGLPESIIVELPGATFGPDNLIGATLFSTGVEQRN
jgi:hypothetical protein